MIYFVIRYSRKRNPKATNIEGNNTLEIVWTVIPLVLVLIMFYFGWLGFRPMRHVPEGAIPIKGYRSDVGLELRIRKRKEICRTDRTSQ